MARHRGTYKPEHPEPYEVSRSQIQSFMNCPACFWMNRVKGIKFPGMPGFLLNSATDTLLKKDFDRYREMQKPHPFMERNGLGHLVPFKHENFELWTKSLQLGLKTFHEPSNLIIGGGLDDVWHDLKTDEIFVVDYKSTAGRKNDEGTALNQITLVGAYKESYKKQMDMYQWILRQEGFNVSRTGYFVYVNDEIDKANMRFDVQLISYDADDSWVEDTILELKNCLLMNESPRHADSGFGPKGDKQCEYAELFDGMKEHKLI